VKEDTGLVSADVYRDMDYRWTKFGLSVEDMPIFAIPLVAAFFLSAFVEVPFTALIFLELCVAVFLVLIKWRKPPDHLENLFLLFTAPRRLSHKLRDPKAGAVFPLDANLNPVETSSSAPGEGR
jgi:hypothetical protein